MSWDSGELDSFWLSREQVKTTLDGRRTDSHVAPVQLHFVSPWSLGWGSDVFNRISGQRLICARLTIMSFSQFFRKSPSLLPTNHLNPSWNFSSRKWDWSRFDFFMPLHRTGCLKSAMNEGFQNSVGRTPLSHAHACVPTHPKHSWSLRSRITGAHVFRHTRRAPQLPPTSTMRAVTALCKVTQSTLSWLGLSELGCMMQHCCTHCDWFIVAVNSNPFCYGVF